jgi:hypothetical protein
MDSSMSKVGVGFFCFLFGTMFGSLIGGFFSYLDIQQFKREAIEAEVAEYQVDKTGDVHFIWKTIE